MIQLPVSRMTDLPSLVAEHQAAILGTALIGTLLAVVCWEALAPRRTEAAGQGYRWANNITLALTTQAIGRVGSAGLAVLLAGWGIDESLGLLSVLEVGFWPALILTLVTLELLAYILHRIFHRVPALWRLHAVHHCDTGVDFSTAFRHHPIEVVIVMAVNALAIVALGPPVAAVVLHQALAITVNMASHGNVALPEGFERWLRYVVVTPDFHRLHHCSDRRFTDSNYSIALPWFDYLLGTATGRPFAEQRTMELGLEDYRTPADSRVDRLLLMPFRRRRPGGTDRPPARTAA